MSTRVAAALALVALVVLGMPTSAQAAIAFVGKSQGQTAGSTTSLSLSKPAGVAAGEMEIATISVNGSATITAPTGWTAIRGDSSGSLQQASYWHISGPTEGTSTWTFSASVPAAGGIALYSGVDSISIVDVASSNTGTGGTTGAVPTVNTTYAGDVVLEIASFNNAGSLTAASGTTSRFSAHASSGPTLLGEDRTQSSAGTTPADTVTDNTSSTGWVTQAIALKPASAAGYLAVSTSATPSFSADLDAGDQTPTYTLPLSTRASVSPPAGWNETVTSTEFSTGSHSLPSTASTIAAAPTIACVTAYANCTAATNSVSYPVSVPAGAVAPAAVKFVNAASATGAGDFTVTPTVAVSVPQNSFAGTYSSTLTIAIVSGP